MAGINDLLTEVGLAGSVTTLSAPGKAIGTFNINVGSTANWPSVGKTVYFAMRTVNPSAITSSNPSGLVAGTYSEWKGIVGTNAITSMQLQTGSTDQVYTAGSNTQVYIPVSAARENALVAWGQVHADNQGNLLTAAVQTALGAGSQALNGYNALAFPFNTVTYLGNRSYQCGINGQDVTGTLSPGFRIRTQRTVAAPTQSTSLNGTTQYWSKTSPAGMTFTDNFTLTAWVKLSSYGSVNIQGRYDGTGGFILRLTAAGQVGIQGLGPGVNRTYDTYQSVPLNKWVHVAATLTMSTGTANIYFDGVSVPTAATSALGTALTQAGIYQVGATNGSGFFPGKIAQAAVFSAVLSQATIQSYISQGLAGTETSLISAYSFNGNANDLNTTNANNLTANASAGYTADSPFGGQGNATISSTLDYGIVQSVSFSTNTTVVIQVPEGCTIPTSGGIAAVSYSSNKVPYGFPAQRGKWRVQMLDRTTEAKSSPTANIWYSTEFGSPQLNIPVGEWLYGYEVIGYCNINSSQSAIFVTLSSTISAETDKDLTSRLYTNAAGATSSAIIATVKREKELSIATATPFYLAALTDIAAVSSIVMFGASGTTKIYAENAYL